MSSSSYKPGTALRKRTKQKFIYRKHTAFNVIGLEQSQALATTNQYQRHGLVSEGNPTFKSCVEGKSTGRKILFTLGDRSHKFNTTLNQF